MLLERVITQSVDPFIFMDVSGCNRVWKLGANAISATPAAGVVSIRARQMDALAEGHEVDLDPVTVIAVRGIRA